MEFEYKPLPSGCESGIFDDGRDAVQCVAPGVILNGGGGMGRDYARSVASSYFTRLSGPIIPIETFSEVKEIAMILKSSLPRSSHRATIVRVWLGD